MRRMTGQAVTMKVPGCKIERGTRPRSVGKFKHRVPGYEKVIRKEKSPIDGVHFSYLKTGISFTRVVSGHRYSLDDGEGLNIAAWAQGRKGSAGGMQVTFIEGEWEVNA